MLLQPLKIPVQLRPVVVKHFYFPSPDKHLVDRGLEFKGVACGNHQGGILARLEGSYQVVYSKYFCQVFGVRMILAS